MLHTGTTPTAVDTDSALWLIANNKLDGLTADEAALILAAVLDVLTDDLLRDPAFRRGLRRLGAMAAPGHAHAIAHDQHQQIAELRSKLRAATRQLDQAERQLEAVLDRIRSERPALIPECCRCNELIVYRVDERRDRIDGIYHEKCYALTFPDCPCCNGPRGDECRCDFQRVGTTSERGSDDQGVAYGDDEYIECVQHGGKFEEGEVWPE